MNKQEKQTKLTHRQLCGGYHREEGGEVTKNKGGQMHGDRRRSDCGWWAHSVAYRSCVIEMYTGNLYSLIDQYHPNKFNEKKNRK